MKKYGLFVSEQKGKKWIHTRMIPRAAFYGKDEAIRCFQPIMTMLAVEGKSVSIRPV